MRWVRGLPSWVVSGIVIFPVLFVVGLLAGAVTSGRVGVLFWLVVPSIVFEEALEASLTALSDDLLANALFALAFWFAIGAGVGLLQRGVERLSAGGAPR
jgi:hypothetical protein